MLIRTLVCLARKQIIELNVFILSSIMKFQGATPDGVGQVGPAGACFRAECQHSPGQTLVLLLEGGVVWQVDSHISQGVKFFVSIAPSKKRQVVRSAFKEEESEIAANVPVASEKIVAAVLK